MIYDEKQEASPQRTRKEAATKRIRRERHELAPPHVLHAATLYLYVDDGREGERERASLRR